MAGRGVENKSANHYRTAKPLLRNLHVRFDWTSERCIEHACRHRKPLTLDAGRLSALTIRSSSAKDALYLRCFRLGVLLAFDDRGLFGSCAARWPQRLPISD